MFVNGGGVGCFDWCGYFMGGCVVCVRLLYILSMYGGMLWGFEVIEIFFFGDFLMFVWRN